LSHPVLLLNTLVRGEKKTTGVKKKNIKARRPASRVTDELTEIVRTNSLYQQRTTAKNKSIVKVTKVWR